MKKHFNLYENMTNMDPFEGPQYYIAPMWAFHVQTAFMSFVLFCGWPLNTLVLLATIKYKKLRAPLNYMLVNISFAAFVFLTYSNTQVWAAAVKGYYFLGYTLCASEAAVAAGTGLVTSWSLAVLSFERYIVICKPFGAFKFGNAHAGAAVAFCWIMGFGAASPPLFGWSRFIPEGLNCACGPDWYTRNEELGTTSYMYFLLTTCFCIPLSVIIFSYSQLLGALRAVAAQQAESASTQKAEKEVSRMIIVMVLSFCACYCPYAITGLVYANSSDANRDYRLVTIPAFLTKSSCVYNPLIYIYMNKQFNACIMEMVFGKKMEDASEVSSKTEVSTAS